MQSDIVKRGMNSKRLLVRIVIFFPILYLYSHQNGVTEMCKDVPVHTMKTRTKNISIETPLVLNHGMEMIVIFTSRPLKPQGRISIHMMAPESGHEPRTLNIKNCFLLLWDRFYFPILKELIVYVS
jgi:hypothetical protein